MSIGAFLFSENLNILLSPWAPILPLALRHLHLSSPSVSGPFYPLPLLPSAHLSVQIHLSHLCLFLSKMSPTNALNLIPLSSPHTNSLISPVFTVYHGFINRLHLNSQPELCLELPIQISNWQWTSPTMSYAGPSSTSNAEWRPFHWTVSSSCIWPQPQHYTFIHLFLQSLLTERLCVRQLEK